MLFIFLLVGISGQLACGAVDAGDDECHIKAITLLQRLQKGQKLNDAEDVTIVKEIQAAKHEILAELNSIKALLNKKAENQCIESGKKWIKWINIGGRKYFFSDFATSWNNAKNICLAHDAQLASIKSESEMEAIGKYLKNRENLAKFYFWLSASDIGKRAGQFVWADGTPLENTSKLWDEGEPNETGPGRDTCVDLYNGSLFDFSCSGELLFICELIE